MHPRECERHIATCEQGDGGGNLARDGRPDRAKPHLYLWSFNARGDGARVPLLDYNKHLQDPKLQQAHLDVAFDVAESMASALLPRS